MSLRKVQPYFAFPLISLHLYQPRVFSGAFPWPRTAPCRIFLGGAITTVSRSFEQSIATRDERKALKCVSKCEVLKYRNQR